MPKGRGSNKRRQSYRQKHPKDKRESTGAGYVKLMALGERAEEVVQRRRKNSPVAKALAKRRKAWEKK